MGSETFYVDGLKSQKSEKRAIFENSKKQQQQQQQQQQQHTQKKHTQRKDRFSHS